MPGTAATVGAIGGAMSLIGALAVVGMASGAAQRLAGAADAAALAAADAASGAATGAPCERAAEVAEANGVTVASCDLAELIATVTLSSTFAGMPFHASARAGPAP